MKRYKYVGVRLSMVTFLFLYCTVSVSAGPLPVTATPPKVTEPDKDGVVADIARLSGNADWNLALSETLQAQGFTAANHWLYSNKPPDPYKNPMSLGPKANFDVTTYTLSVTDEKVKEVMKFTLKDSTANPAPNHWLQLINESQPFPTSENGGKPFGFQIAGFSGYWQVDNGDKAPGDGPYYDSNAGPNIVPPAFSDTPSQDSPPYSYMHFYAIPAWDVVKDGNHYIVVADEGVAWGWQETPEPSTLTLLSIGSVGLVGYVWRRRKQAAA
jgi:hypothetical protein